MLGPTAAEGCSPGLLGNICSKHSHTPWQAWLLQEAEYTEAKEACVWGKVGWLAQVGASGRGSQMRWTLQH